jgi:hypothetical protein
MSYRQNWKFSESKNSFFKVLGVVLYAYNPSTWEAEAGGLWVLGQLGLHSKTMFYLFIYLFIYFKQS